MNTPNSSLHELISKLTSAERSYFRRQASRHTIGEANHHLQLFDRMHAQDVYDEVALKEWFVSIGGKPQQFASLKHFLQTSLLAAMNDLHRDRHPHRQIRELIAQAQFLKIKGLGEECIKLLRSAEKMAHHYEQYDALVQIVGLKSTLSIQMDAQLSLEALRSLQSEIDEAMQSQRTLQDLQYISNQLSILGRTKYHLRSGEEVAMIDAMEAMPVLAAAQPGFMRQYLWLRIHATLAHLRGNASLSHHYRVLIMKLWEDFPDMAEVLPNARSISIANLLAACCEDNRFEELWEVICSLKKSLKEMKYKDLAERNEIEQNAAYYELVYHLNTQGWSKADDCVKRLEAFLEQPASLVHLGRATAIRYNLAVLHFMKQAYRKVVRVANQIIHEEPHRHRMDLQQGGRILYAIAHYELGNLDILDGILDSLHKYLVKEGTLYQFEKQLLVHLRLLLRKPSGPERKPIFQDLMNILQSSDHDPQFRMAPGVREIGIWLQARMTDRTLLEVVAAQPTHKSSPSPESCR